MDRRIMIGEDLQWKTCDGQASVVRVAVCGRGSAMVCAKSAKIAATVRAENFIVHFLNCSFYDCLVEVSTAVHSMGSYI
jgi:hypothetical protein